MKFIYLFTSLVFALNIANGQNNSEEYVSIILQVSKAENGDINQKIVQAKLHQSKLKSPTQLSKIKRGTNAVKLEILSKDEAVLQQYFINDPLHIHREYVDEQGKLQRKDQLLDTRSILVRRPVSTEATNIRMTSVSPTRSKNTLTFKIR